MGAAHLAAAHLDGRSQHLLGSQLCQQKTDRHHVGDGVHGADFMEMDLVCRFSMSVAFRFRHQIIDCQRMGTHLLRQPQAIDDCGYIF